LYGNYFLEPGEKRLMKETSADAEGESNIPSEAVSPDNPTTHRHN
jgi:hypothetical protein